MQKGNYDLIEEIGGVEKSTGAKYDLICEVEKFNPFHGADGRFASASGYSSFTIRTKDPKKQHMADMAMARMREQAASDGTTRVTNAENAMKSLVGSNVNLKGCDPDCAEEAVAAVKKVMDRYPIAKDAIKGITTDDVDDTFKNRDTIMAAYDNSTRMIHLNTKYYGNKTEFDKAVKESEEKKFHPEGLKSDSTIVHEIGHALDHYVSEITLGYREANFYGERISTRKWNNDINAAKRKGEKVTTFTIRDSLSLYASKSPSEYFAEGFAEGMMSATPRKTAASIMKHLDGYVKKAEAKLSQPQPGVRLYNH